MATVYIAPTAQGSADGTSAANAYAFTSVATAETDAGSGGTIIFVDGTYTLATHLDLASSITYGVTYQPQTVGGVTISGAYGVRIGNTSMAGAIIFNDFILDIGDITQANNHGLRFINASGGSITMNRCDCKIAIDIGSFGTAIGHNNGSTADGERIDAYLNSCLFKINNDATGTTDYALSMIGAGATDGSSIPKNFTITNCTFVALNGGKCSFLMYNQNGSQAYGTCVVKNTIVHSEGTTSAIVWGHNGGQLNMSYSNYYNPNGSWTIGGYNTGTAHTLTDNINVESQFVDSTTSDYRLRPSSPCINAGTAS